MESWLIETAKQVPAIVCIVVIVSLYVKHSKEQSKGAFDSAEQQRTAFLAAMDKQDTMFVNAMSQQMEYLKGRDAQSRQIAESGHAALRELALEVQNLRENTIKHRSSKS